MKILNSSSKNFDKNLDSLLLQRRKKVKSNSVSVSSIIKEVKRYNQIQFQFRVLLKMSKKMETKL